MLAIESTQPDVAKLIINHQRFTTVRDCELAAAINLSQIDVLKDLIATDKVSQATVFNQAIKQESVNVVSFCLGLLKQSNLFDDINWAKLTHVKSKKLKEILSNHLFQPLDEYIESLNSLMSNKMLDPIVIFRFGNIRGIFR